MMWEQLQRLAEAHGRLKARVHAYRAPIKSRFGLFAVGCVYFTVPLVVGYFVFHWSEGVRDSNLGTAGARRDKLLAAKARWGGPPALPMATAPGRQLRPELPPAKVL
jgi:hypothetical protein